MNNSIDSEINDLFQELIVSKIKSDIEVLKTRMKSDIEENNEVIEGYIKKCAKENSVLDIKKIVDEFKDDYEENYNLSIEKLENIEICSQKLDKLIVLEEANKTFFENNNEKLISVIDELKESQKKKINSLILCNYIFIVCIISLIYINIFS